jgi:ABC-2 type transport system ATP-binding protein
VNTLIEASHLRKTFGTTVAVDDLCLHVEEGEIYGLVGSDGAGKTTTIRLLVGALKLDSGNAAVSGYSLATQAERARTQIGYLSQRFSLYEDLSVLENIRFFAGLRGLSRQEWLPRCLEILEFVGLSAFKDRRAGQLSGGMKQKLGLASALVTRPTVLLLDEPTTGVDPVTRQDFWQLLIRIVLAPHSDSSSISNGNAHSRRGVLLTTPYMDEASRCTRVGFMRAGRIIAEGTPSELRRTLEGRILEVRGQSSNFGNGKLASLRQIAQQINGVEDVRLFGDKLHLRVRSGAAESVMAAVSNASFLHDGAPVEVRLFPPSLEDVFISLQESDPHASHT